MLFYTKLDVNSTRQPKKIWQHRPNLLPQIHMSRLPPLHTVMKDIGENAHNLGPTTLMEFWNLQRSRPLLRRTYNMIEDFLVGLQRRWVSRDA